MTTVAARPQSRKNLLHGVVMLLAVVLAATLCLAPQADARKKRVVAISPFAAQTMVQLGVRPIAVGETLGATNRQRRLLRRIPMLRLSHPNGPNLERMARIRPDIVFSSSRWNAGHSALRRLGIRVVVADPTVPQGVYANVRRIGRVLGRQRQANRLIRGIRRQVNRVPTHRGAREKVLVVLGIGRTAMAFLGNSWGGQIVSLAGGRLVTGGAKARGGFARISDERIIEENPDRIIVVPHGTSQDLSQVADYVLNNPAWQTTNAVKNGNLHISGDNTLLQAGTDLGPVIRQVRNRYLRG